MDYELLLLQLTDLFKPLMI